MAAGTARRATDDLKGDLRDNELHDVGVRIDRLDTNVNDRIDRLDTQVNGRIDRLESRLTAAMVETRTEMRTEFGSVRAELIQMHETQGRILEAIRALSPVGDQR
jgi:hypothetical protein